MERFETDAVKIQARKELEKLILNGKIYHLETNEIAKEILATFNELDDGKIGKVCEIVIRHYLTPTSKRYGVTKNDKWYCDVKILRGGRYLKVEIKTACGELQKVSFCDFMVYCPVVDFNNPLQTQFFVIPKDDFLQIMDCNNYAGSGQVTRRKSSTAGKLVISFQSFWSETRPKQSRKLADYIWSNCERYETIEEWK